MLGRNKMGVKILKGNLTHSSRRTALIAVCVAVCLIIPSLAWASTNELPKTMVRFAEAELVKLGRNPVVVQAVKAQNAKRVGLQKIEEIDKWWKASEKIEPFMFDLMRNRCALILMNFSVDNKFVLEAFVMDNQGALVALSLKTSDYWQGDEAKFTESFKNGAGAIHYGDVEFDDSTGEIQVQISVPVMEGQRAIGAITFGISLDRWERR